MAETGTVKFFNTDKGFGFIKPDNGGADIFVHISAVQASGLSGLTENQKVSFDTEPDRRGKGPKAVNLQISADTTQPVLSSKLRPGIHAGFFHSACVQPNGPNVLS